MLRRMCIQGLSVFLLLSFWLFTQGQTVGQEDLEQEFFSGVEAMENEYIDFEQAAFEEFRREVQDMWQDFVVSTKKDWVEYSEEKAGRSRVDFESGEVQVEVLVPKEQAERNPKAVTERLSQEIERLVEDRGKTRDYPLPTPPPVEEPPPVAPPEKIPPKPLLPEPVLEGQLQTHAGRPVTKENKEEFAREIVETKTVKEVVVDTPKGAMVKAGVTFSLVPDHLRIRGEKIFKPC